MTTMNTDERGERLKQIREDLADGYLSVYQADSQVAFGRLLADSRFLLSLLDSQEASIEIEIERLRDIEEEWITAVRSGLIPIEGDTEGHATPDIGAKIICLICAFKKPWGIFDNKTGAAVCIECHRINQEARRLVHPTTGADLHDTDCLYRTHNGQCDCSQGSVITDAATRMREACVEKVRAARKVWGGAAMPGHAVDQLIAELKSLTLDSVAEKGEDDG